MRKVPSDEYSKLLLYVWLQTGQKLMIFLLSSMFKKLPTTETIKHQKWCIVGVINFGDQYPPHQLPLEFSKYNEFKTPLHKLPGLHLAGKLAYLYVIWKNT